MTNLSMEEAFQLWLKRLDDSYQNIRDIHTDPQWLNDDHKKYKDLLAEFMDIQTQIFQFKILWHTITKE